MLGKYDFIDWSVGSRGPSSGVVLFVFVPGVEAEDSCQWKHLYTHTVTRRVSRSEPITVCNPIFETKISHDSSILHPSERIKVNVSVLYFSLLLIIIFVYLYSSLSAKEQKVVVMLGN